MIDSLSIVLGTLTVLVILSFFFTSEISSFLRYWYARNIVKGPSEFIHSLHESKGQRVLRVGRNEYSITDPALIKTIYNDKDFVKSDQYEAFDVNGQQTIFSLRDSAEHATRVKAVRDLFKSSSVSAGRKIIDARCKHVLDFIEHEAEAGNRVDILALMRGYAVQTISDFALKKAFQAHKSVDQVGIEFGLVLDDINMNSSFGRSTAFLIQLFNRIQEKLKRVRQPSTNINAAELQRAYQAYDDFVAEVIDDVSTPVEYRDRLIGLGLSRETVQAEISDLMFAGTDSSATTLTTALYHLYSSEESLAMLRKATATNGDEAETFMNAVVDESLRLASPVPRRLPRVVPHNKDIFYEEDKHGDGWTKIMPAGSVVGIGAYTLHRNPAVFADPEVFRPNRWIDCDAESRQQMREHFVPFGKGVRACIGQDLARSEMKHMIRSIVNQFDGTVIAPLHGLRYIDNFNATIDGGAVYVLFTKRTV